MALNAQIIGGPRDGEHMPMASFPVELHIIERCAPAVWSTERELPGPDAVLGGIGRYAQRRGFDGEVYYERVGVRS
jgi:hypothetical protein